MAKNTNSITTASGADKIEVTYRQSLMGALSRKTINAIIARIKATNPQKQYWDYRDKLEESTIAKAIDKSPEHPMGFIYEEMIDWEVDYHLEISGIQEALEWNDDKIMADLEVEDKSDIDFEKMAKEIRDFFVGYIETDIDIKQITPEVLCRVTMHSNYDCINSWWLESQGGFNYPDSYFADMVNILEFNPKDIKAMLIADGYKVTGTWRDYPHRIPYVSIEDFKRELHNMSCGANLLTLPCLVSGYELLTIGIENIEVILVKGSCIGMFSSFQGGGSVLEMKLLRDFKAIIGKKYDKSGYLNFGISVDSSSGDYSIKCVYGISNDAFGEASIHKYKPKKIKAHV